MRAVRLYEVLSTRKMNTLILECLFSLFWERELFHEGVYESEEDFMHHWRLFKIFYSFNVILRLSFLSESTSFREVLLGIY